MAAFHFKGYTLIQEEVVNHNYMIFDPNGNYVLHASYEGELLTKKEAQEHIKRYLEFRKGI